MMNTSTSYENATGKIDYGMTNDYMFRAVLQENKHVLKGLICSLLYLRDEDISSVEITNPIVLGKHIDAKSFILDIHVLLNNNHLINLEMQMSNLGNWRERSLSYLCRTYDQLNKREDYVLAKPVIHIGFLNFSLPELIPEFYATYQLLNKRNHQIYSDKFTLSVVNLTQIKLATEEDMSYQIDYWAKLFTAKTWEELKMIAKNNEVFSEATQSLYRLNADEIIREQCRARQDYENHERYTRETLAAQAQQIESQTMQIECQTMQIESQTMQIESLSNENELLKKRIAELEAQSKQ